MNVKTILTTITVMTVWMHLLNAQTTIPNDLEVNGYVNSSTKEFRFANEMELNTSGTADLNFRSNDNNDANLNFYDKQGNLLGKVRADNNGTYLGLEDRNGNYVFTAKPDDYTDLRVGGGIKLRAKADGKIGIGINNPTHKLHVNGNFRVGYTNDYLSVTHSGGNIKISKNGSGDMYFQKNNATKMVITDDGLAIGTTSIPNGYKLAVDGKVICEELKVNLSADWPDYVADENYEVVGPIAQEKAFRETGALPGFPTEAELNGTIDLGEMTRLQQEKIEELMLICSKQEQVINDMTDKFQKLDIIINHKK